MDDIIERLKPRSQQVDEAESRERLAAILADPPASRRRAPLLLAAAAAVICVGTAVAVGAQVLDGPDDSGQQQGVPTTECQPLLRIDGTVYAAASYVEGVATTPAGRAEASTCQDNSADPAGSTFPADPATVEVVALGDLPAGRVVGTPLGSGFTVYVDEDLPASERQQVLADLESAK